MQEPWKLNKPGPHWSQVRLKSFFIYPSGQSAKHRELNKYAILFEKKHSVQTVDWPKQLLQYGSHNVQLLFKLLVNCPLGH
jgi:hypothetical protein